MALSIGFGNSISLLPAIQATRLLTFASVGLPPTEHTCFFLVALPYGEFSPVRLQGRYVRRGLPNRLAHIVASLGLLPSFVLSAFIVVILGLSRGTSRAGAPPFERPSPLYPRGPRSGPAFALPAIIASSTPSVPLAISPHFPCIAGYMRRLCCADSSGLG